jgi:hypothetical protein
MREQPKEPNVISFVKEIQEEVCYVESPVCSHLHQ